MYLISPSYKMFRQISYNTIQYIFIVLFNIPWKENSEKFYE